MIRVTLDLTCSICDHDQFYLPVRAEERQQIRCANCTAFKCDSGDLENEMIALSRARKTLERTRQDGEMAGTTRRAAADRVYQARANAA